MTVVPPLSRGTAVALGLFGVLAISTDSLITRAVDVDGWDVAFWTGLWTGVVMAGYTAVTSGPGPLAVVRRDGRPLVVSGVCQMISGIAFILAVKAAPVANVVAIVAAVPAAAALMAWLRLGERISRRVAAAIVGASGGIVVVVAGSLESGGLEGSCYAIVAILSFGWNLTVWRLHPALSRPGAVGMAGWATALVAVLPAGVELHDTRTMVLLFVMGGLSGPLARVAMASSTRVLSAAEVALFTPIETVAATTWAWLAFDERPRVPTWVGGAIVVVAVLQGLSARGADNDGGVGPRGGPPASGTCRRER